MPEYQEPLYFSNTSTFVLLLQLCRDKHQHHGSDADKNALEMYNSVYFQSGI